MEKSAFISLVNKYLDGSASEGERRLLDEYYTRLETKASTVLTADEEARLHSIIFSEIANPLPGGVAVPVRTITEGSMRHGRGGFPYQDSQQKSRKCSEHFRLRPP